MLSLLLFFLLPLDGSLLIAFTDRLTVNHFEVDTGRIRLLIIESVVLAGQRCVQGIYKSGKNQKYDGQNTGP
jgi:hypothetical protein